jgi:RimJ/RimL family protein N-acetyltransferase
MHSPRDRRKGGPRERSWVFVIDAVRHGDETSPPCGVALSPDLNQGLRNPPMPPLTNAPELTTDRLLLRGPRQSDLPAFTRFVTSAPSMVAQGETGSDDQAWFAFLTGVGHWHWHGFGFFTLEDRATGAPVGRVGLLKHLHWPEIELAWHLFEDGEGRGFATEAAQAVKAWAGAALGLNRLESYINGSNTRSQAVARRLGAATDGTRAPHEPLAEVWVHPMDPLP